MSASRKKQARKAAEEPVITSRAQEEQAKEAQRKRNTLIYTIVGAVIAILVIALLVWNSGVIQRSGAAAEINGEKVTAGEVAYYYYNNTILSTAQTYSAYGITGFPYDITQSPKDQIIAENAVTDLGIEESYVGKTYHDYFLDYALNSLRDEYARCAAAEQAGYKLSDAAKEEIEATLESLDANIENYLTSYGADLSRTKYLQMIYGNTMTEKIYKNCLENSYLASEYFAEAFDAQANYSDAELEAYYEANKVALDSVTYYLQTFTPDTVETSDDVAEDVKAAAEELAAATALANAETALAEAQADFDSVKNNEAYTKTTQIPYSTLPYYDWLVDDARVSGDATLIESDTGSWYVVVFEERFRDETPTVNVRHILVEAKNEDNPATADVDESTNDPTEEVWAAAKEKAQKLLDQWKAGEATEDSFAALVADNSADTGSNTNGGLYENVRKGNMIENFDSWIFDAARQSGDVSEPIQNDQSSTKGWHIIYYVGQEDPVWVTTVRQFLWSDELTAGIEIVRTDKLDNIIQ